MSDQDEIWERDDMIVALRARVAQLEAALGLCADALNDDRIGTTRNDDPDWYAKVWAARAALKDAPQ